MFRTTLKNLYYLIAQSKAGAFLLNKKFSIRYSNAAAYWENRYRKNGNSGDGSYGKAAIYKASIINHFIQENEIESVIEFGCGDGNQLKQYNIKNYTGYDVAPSSIGKCKSSFKNDTGKRFELYKPFHYKSPSQAAAELALSIDVIYHLVEDKVYRLYMQHLFESSTRYVIIYAWDQEGSQNQHVKPREFSTWVNEHQPCWKLIQLITSKPSEGYCDFFMYEKFAPANAK